MKGKRLLILGLVLGTFGGWVLGYLRLPFVERNDSFWVGFGAGLLILFVLVSMLYVWNKNNFLLRLIGKNQANEDTSKKTNTYTLIWLLVSTFVFLGSLLSVWMIQQQSDYLQQEIDQQNLKIHNQSLLIESVRQSNMLFLGDNIERKIRSEVEGNSLSDEAIERIANLCASFKPYASYEIDSLSVRKWSPERGKILLTLTRLKLDTVIFNKIKKQVSFAAADLRGANLSGVDLSGINLQGANFQDADLRAANMSNADLTDTKFRKAYLDGAQFKESNLRSSNLRWANMQGCDLRSANLNGCDLSFAKLTKSNFMGAICRYSKMDGALLNEVNLQNCDIIGAKFKKANLNKANLTNVKMAYNDFSAANITNAILERANVDAEWMDKIDDWQVIGRKELQNKYQIVKDTSTQFRYHKFCLMKK